MKEVSLISPAKVSGERRRAGATVLVDATTLAQLVAAGAVRADAAHDPGATQAALSDTQVRAFTQAEFEAATAAAAKMLAEAMIEAALIEVTAAFEAEKAALLARAVDAEAQRDMLQDRVLELQEQLSAAKTAAEQAGAVDDQQHPPGGTAAPVQPDTPAETVAKTTPKKGAAAKPKG